MASATKTVTMNVDASKIYQVLTDYENYPDFMDGVNQVEVLSQDGNTAMVQYHINIIKKFTYTLNCVAEENKSVKWTFDSGDLFKASSGSWELEDNGDGTTDVTYQIDADFKMMVPGMVTKKLISANLPSLMQSVEDKAKAL